MKKNILILVTDQLSSCALSSYGNHESKTPNINKIFEEGVGFESAYCSYPMCQPSRASFWSSQYPHETRVLSNGKKWPVNDLGDDIDTLGKLFSRNGYKAVHFGKKHDAGALSGFECAEELATEVDSDYEEWPLTDDSFRDIYTVNKAISFLETYSEEIPFIMVADFINPHNICQWVGDYTEGKAKRSNTENLPTLPENFRFEDIVNRPKAVQYICCSHNRQAQASDWSDRDFRRYLEAYYYYLEIVDRQIGKILTTLKNRKDGKDTLIVFLSDHGDSMTARGRVTKQVDFYEEVTKVPLVFSGPEINGKSKLLNEIPVSLLDLVPTLCDYAHIKIKGMAGESLLPLLQNKGVIARDYVVSEWCTEWGYTVSPGRMIRNKKFKYIKYLEENEEELYDLKKDPYEKINLVGHRDYAEIQDKMRQLLETHLEQTNDPFYTEKVHVAHRWREHSVGYRNHKGLAAPEFYEKNK